MFRRTLPKQPEGLINVLLDSKAEFGDRDDAAMDLAQYDESEAEHALVQIATDPATDPDLADSCGESLAEIWCRKGRVDFDVLTRLQEPALTIALAILKLRKPEWESLIEEKLHHKRQLE